MATVAQAPQAGRRSNAWALLPFTVLALVALTLGVIARNQETGTGKAQGTYIELLFTSTIHMKAWLATAVAVLACAQLFTAAWIFAGSRWSAGRG
jgi:ABC-type multidrug transport system permease subunit